MTYNVFGGMLNLTQSNNRQQRHDVLWSSSQLSIVYSLSVNTYFQGFCASWKAIKFFLKFPGPGKSSWKMSLVLESPGN